MGGTQSSQKVLNEVISNTMMNSMMENSTTVSASSDQKNTMSIVGNKSTAKDMFGNVIKSTISNIAQENSSKINVSALSNAASNGSLQADMMSKLDTALQQQIPALQFGTQLKQDVSNIVKNNIDVNISVKNLQNIAANVSQSNEIKILANENMDVTTLSQKNEATLIAELVNKTSSDMATQITAKTETSSAVKSETQNILPDFGMIFIVIIILVICGGGFYLSTLGWDDLTKPIPLAVIAAIVVSVFGGIFLAAAPAKK
jgi:hypothetical protein